MIRHQGKSDIVHHEAGDESTGDYAEFESTGFLHLHGDARYYDDLPPTPLLAARPGATAPALGTFTANIEQFVYQVGDYSYGSTELTHGYAEGTDIEAHIHWATDGLELVSKTVKWELVVAVSNLKLADPFSDAFSERAALYAETVIPASTPSRAHIYSDFTAAISGTGIKVGAYIAWRLKRVEATAGAGERPAADPYGLAVGFHVIQDTIGSRTEHTK